MKLKWTQLALAIIATLWVAAGVAAEDFPAKPIRLFVGLSAGSATDNLTHLGIDLAGVKAGISMIHVRHRAPRWCETPS